MASADVSTRPGGAATIGPSSAMARHAGESRSSSLIWLRLWHNPRVVASSLVLLIIVAVAVFAPWLTPQDPMQMDSSARLQGPSAEHRLGTDEYGRDLLSRIILGSRTSIVVAVLSVAAATVVGTIFGLVGSYFGGIWEVATMRSVDVLLTFPPILLAIAVVAFVGPSLPNLIGVIALLYMPRFARIAHGAGLQVKQREFVEAARVLGAGTPRILWLAVLPNILAPIFVQISLSLGFAILLESGLSFLGLGTPPPEPSWGNMVGVARGYMRQSGWFVLWPSLAISLTILCFNTLGDGLRDSLDPRLKR
jgi:peptide/nickel transport system permease protein